MNFKRPSFTASFLRKTLRDQPTIRKRASRWIAILSLLLLTLVNLPYETAQVQAKSADKPSAESLAFTQEVWLITDLHYMSPSLTDQGQRYQIFQKQAAGIDYDYGPDRLEALLVQIDREQPAAIIVAGDLTSNGEYQSMVDLADYFARMEAIGTQVFVIPGNHDIHNGWAVRFEGKEALKEKQTSPQEFAEIFSDFGYAEAVSRDPASLSYLAQLGPNWQVLMLDTSIYSDKPGKGQSESRGHTKAETLEWAATLLSVTPNETLVLPVMHHGALSHSQGELQQTTATKASNLQKLLAHHQLPLTLTGHLHSQHLTTLRVDDTPLHEIVTTAFSIYPGKIGSVTFTPEQLAYQQIDLDMETWLGADHYSDYLSHLKTLHTKATHIKVFDTLYNDAALKPHTDEISAVFQALNLSFFKGSIREDWPTLEPALASIERYIEATDYRFFNGYLDLVLSTKDYSQTDLKIEWEN